MRKLLSLITVLLLFSCSHSRGTQGSESSDIAMASPSRMVQRPKIVIDAGHGGRDAGALSLTTPNHQEKNLNLKMALMLESYLQRMGYQTILTRGDDHFIPLSLRAIFANGNRATLFVSVHVNAAKNTKAEGVEVYYYPSKDDVVRANSSRKLAKVVLDQIVANTECKSRGVKEGNFAVIRETKMPAILVEGGFVTNANELKKLIDPAYQKNLVGSIAMGIHRYLKFLQ